MTAVWFCSHSENKWNDSRSQKRVPYPFSAYSVYDKICERNVSNDIYAEAHLIEHISIFQLTEGENS